MKKVEFYHLVFFFNYTAEFCVLKVFQLLLMLNQNELPYFHAFILIIANKNETIYRTLDLVMEINDC